MNVRSGVLAAFAIVAAAPAFGATLHADLAKATLSAPAPRSER